MLKNAQRPDFVHTHAHTHVSVAKPKNEAGRSLVEMLGMLAIMGIFGLTGVKAYTYAMNKHRANELLNEARKRAVVIAMQITTGKTDISTVEFKDEVSYGTFGEPFYDAKTNTFSIPLMGVEAKICGQMKTSTGINSSLGILGSCGKDLTLVFNEDLTSGIATLTPDGWTNGDGSVCAEETGYGSECRVCVDGKYTDSDAVCQTAYGQETRKCIDGICVAKSGGTGCLYNSDCKNQIADGTESNCGIDGCFCFYNGTVDEVTGPSGYVGTCKLKTSYTGVFPNDGMKNEVAYSSAEAEGYIRSSNFTGMDWFSALNFCRSYNKNLVSFKDFGISFILSGGCSTYSGNYSCNITEDEWDAIKAKFGGNGFYPWTKDIVMPSKTRAYASDFGREDPYIYVYSRRGGRHALCH